MNERSWKVNSLWTVKWENRSQTGCQRKKTSKNQNHPTITPSNVVNLSWQHSPLTPEGEPPLAISLGWWDDSPSGLGGEKSTNSLSWQLSSHHQNHQNHQNHHTIIISNHHNIKPSYYHPIIILPITDFHALTPNSRSNLVHYLV